MKLAPMKPAPPVTKIIGANPCGGARILSCSGSRIGAAVILAIPRDEAREPFGERRRRREARRGRKTLDRCESRRHVALLQRQIFLDRATAQEPFQLSDE